MRNSSSVTSVTRPSTCSVCDRPCTASLPESGCVLPASPPWPDVAPVQGNNTVRFALSCILNIPCRPSDLKRKQPSTPQLLPLTTYQSVVYQFCVKIHERRPLHCRNYNQDTDEEDDEEESEEEESEEDEEDEEENDYKAMGHSCEYHEKFCIEFCMWFHYIVSTG